MRKIHFLIWVGLIFSFLFTFFLYKFSPDIFFYKIALFASLMQLVCIALVMRNFYAGFILGILSSIMLTVLGFSLIGGNGFALGVIGAVIVLALGVFYILGLFITKDTIEFLALEKQIGQLTEPLVVGKELKATYYEIVVIAVGFLLCVACLTIFYLLPNGGWEMLAIYLLLIVLLAFGMLLALIGSVKMFLNSRHWIFLGVHDEYLLLRAKSTHTAIKIPYALIREANIYKESMVFSVLHGGDGAFKIFKIPFWNIDKAQRESIIAAVRGKFEHAWQEDD